MPSSFTKVTSSPGLMVSVSIENFALLGDESIVGTNDGDGDRCHDEHAGRNG
jgi:hypothetical protein